MAGETNPELDRPSSAARLIGATFEVYWRFPVLFLILAGAVVVPYNVIVLLATGTGPLARRELGLGREFLLSIIEIGLVTPLISALHVHAVRQIGDGNRPRLLAVAKPSFAALPVVSAAAIMSFLGMTLGLIALIIPGVLLWLRWAVVAQAAALGRKGWIDALRRSADLTEGNYTHVFGLAFSVGVISLVPNVALERIFGHTDTTVASFVAGTSFNVLVWSFTALATALLYFDLSARHEIAEGRPRVETGPPRSLSGRPVAPTGHPLDPNSYSDEDRPPGWYIDPQFPRTMRYWAADGTPTWSKRSSRTPKQTLNEWFEYHKREERPEERV